MWSLGCVFFKYITWVTTVTGRLSLRHHGYDLVSKKPYHSSLEIVAFRLEILPKSIKESEKPVLNAVKARLNPHPRLRPTAARLSRSLKK
jgi:hypothetical protein